MKNVVLLILMITLSCSDGDRPVDHGSIKDKWKLIERLADPGDGSGVYEPVSSDKTLTFFTDGKVVSNASLCIMNASAGQPGTGVYDLNKNEIIPDSCKTNKIAFHIEEGYLFLDFICIEPCGEKYERIQ